MTLEEICLPVKTELSQVDEVIHAHLASAVPFVTHVAEYTTQNGGKRLRPIFCLFASRLAGVSGRAVVESAAAMEFFHTATLMHDDVIDAADLRRGKPSTNSRWGNQVAVLVGDFFYCRASDLLVRTGNLRIIQLITRVMRVTTEGEIFEISKSNDLNTTEQDYLRIAEEKTAVLISASCEIGGILGNVSEEFTGALRDYGRNVGIAFQLADDVLDYVSETDRFGKTRGTDLREGKLTLPLILALRKANENERRIIKDTLIAEKLEERHLREIVSILEKYDSLKAALALAQTFVQKAKESLQIFKPSMEREALNSLADYVIQREH